MTGFSRIPGIWGAPICLGGPASHLRCSRLGWDPPKVQVQTNTNLSRTIRPSGCPGWTTPHDRPRLPDRAPRWSDGPGREAHPVGESLEDEMFLKKGQASGFVQVGPVLKRPERTKLDYPFLIHSSFFLREVQQYPLISVSCVSVRWC